MSTRPAPQSSRTSNSRQPRRRSSPHSRRGSQFETVREATVGRENTALRQSNKPRHSYDKSNQLERPRHTCDNLSQSSRSASSFRRSSSESERPRNVNFSQSDGSVRRPNQSSGLITPSQESSATVSRERSRNVQSGSTGASPDKRKNQSDRSTASRHSQSEKDTKPRDRKNSKSTSSRRRSDLSYDARDEWENTFRPLNDGYFLNEVTEVTSLAGREIPSLPRVRQAGMLAESLEFASMFTPGLTKSAPSETELDFTNLDKETLENERLGLRYDVELLKREKHRAMRRFDLHDVYRIGEWRTGIRVRDRKKSPEVSSKVSVNSDNLSTNSVKFESRSLNSRGYMDGPPVEAFSMRLDTDGRTPTDPSWFSTMSSERPPSNRTDFSGSFKSVSTLSSLGSTKLSSIAEPLVFAPAPVVRPNRFQVGQQVPKALNF